MVRASTSADVPAASDGRAAVDFTGGAFRPALDGEVLGGAGTLAGGAGRLPSLPAILSTSRMAESNRAASSSVSAGFAVRDFALSGGFAMDQDYMQLTGAMNPNLRGLFNIGRA